MPAFWRSVPNQITALRLLMVPLLWLLALREQAQAVGLGLAFCGFSDWLDGLLARRLNQTSPDGAKFDSIVDQLLLVSTVVWVAMLRPEVFQENQGVVMVSLAVYLLSLGVGLIKFHRLANLHLLLSRITAYVLYIFLIHTFLADRYSPLLFWSAWVMFTLSSTETLILQLISSQVDEHMGSLIRVMRLRRGARIRPRDPAQEGG
jgi:phosphatidylglycerophosphate synthase